MEGKTSLMSTGAELHGRGHEHPSEAAEAESCSRSRVVVTIPVLEADHHGREHEHEHEHGPKETKVEKADRTMHGSSATATVVVPLPREPERVRDVSTVDGENGDWCTAGCGRGASAAMEDAPQLASKTEEAAEPSSSGEIISEPVLASVGLCSRSPTQSRPRASEETTNARWHASTP